MHVLIHNVSGIEPSLLLILFTYHVIFWAKKIQKYNKGGSTFVKRAIKGFCPSRGFRPRGVLYVYHQTHIFQDSSVNVLLQTAKSSVKSGGVCCLYTGSFWIQLRNSYGVSYTIPR